MCEYCTSNLDERKEAIIPVNNAPLYDGNLKPYADKTINGEIKIWLDDADDNLLFQNMCSFDNQPEKFDSIGKFGIEYCPWCGRKLHND